MPRFNRYSVGPVTAMLLGLAIALPVEAAFFEPWDDPVSQQNGFYYFNQSTAPDGDAPLNWESDGGNPGGYVWLDLVNATGWDAITSTRNHWVAYAYGVDHPIDASIDNRLTFSMGADPGFDLGGAPVTFWLGEWNDPDGDTGPIEPSFSFFYLDLGVRPGDGVWADLLIDLDPAGPWVTLADNQSKTATDRGRTTDGCITARRSTWWWRGRGRCSSCRDHRQYQ
jgi:hypothetical protein